LVGEGESVSALPESPAASSDGVGGVWALEVQTPRGIQPISLVLRQVGDRIEGELEGGPISDVTSEHGAVSFRASLTQPFPVKIRVKAQVHGDSIEGSAKASMLPIALSFTGTRVQA
jgi:hypothetical protein